MKKKLQAILMLVTIATVITATIMYNANISDIEKPEIIVEEEPVKPKEWHDLGDADPGGDNSGYMYGMNYPYQATPTTAYASNLSNGTAYEFSDSLDAEMTNETPHTTPYDIVIKFRVNDTIGYNTSSSEWEISWVRILITVDFDYATDVGPLQAMEMIEIGNNSDFAWYHGYLQDADGGAGSGFQITHGELFNQSDIRIQVYH
jgi:hypothetical protein